MSAETESSLRALITGLPAGVEKDLKQAALNYLNALSCNGQATQELGAFKEAAKSGIMRPSVLMWLADNHRQILLVAGANKTQIDSAGNILRSHFLAGGAPSGGDTDTRIAFGALDFALVVLLAILLLIVIVFLVCKFLAWRDGNAEYFRRTGRPIYMQETLSNGVLIAGLDSTFSKATAADFTVGNVMAPLLREIPSKSGPIAT